MLLTPKRRNFYELILKLVLVALVHITLIGTLGILLQKYLFKMEQQKQMKTSQNIFRNYQTQIEQEYYINTIIKETSPKNLASIKNYIKALESSDIYAQIYFISCDKQSPFKINIPISPFAQCFNLKISEHLSAKNKLFILLLIFITFLSSLPIYFFLLTNVKKQAELKIKSEIIDEVKHNMNSPLITLHNIVESNALVLGEDLSHQIKSKLEDIKNYLQKIDFPKQTVSQKEVVSLHQVIEKIVHDKRIELTQNAKNIKMETILRASSIYLLMNRIDCESVLSNILNNAFNAIEQEGIVKISTDNDGDFIKLVVSDTGRGIKPEHLSEIFKKGFSYKTQNGTGSGLYQALYKLKKINGDIKVHSIEDHGTSLTLYFPLLRMRANQIKILEDDLLLTKIYEKKIAQSSILKEIAIDFYPNQESLLQSLNGIKGHNVLFILDAQIMDNPKAGIDLAYSLNDLGFKNIYMHSAYSSEHFKELSFISGLIKKDNNQDIVYLLEKSYG